MCKLKAIVKGESLKLSYKSIYDCIEQMVYKYTNRVAFKFIEDYSYLEILKRTNKTANYFKSKGIKKNQVVAIDLNKDIDFVICVFALMKLHATCLIIGENIIHSNFDFYINDANISHLICYSKCELCDYVNIINFDITDCEKYYELEMHTCAEDSIDDIAFIFYTSGTTGMPQKVGISHGNILNDTCVETARPVLELEDIFLLTSPKTSLRITGEIFYPFFAGVKNVICTDETSRNIKEILSIMIEEKITVFFAVPTMLRELVKFKEFWKKNSLRMIQSLGESLDTELLKKLLDETSATIYNVYGQTEAGMCSTYAISKDDVIIYCGLPVPNRNLYILNENKELVDVNIEGDIYIGGKYLNYKNLNIGGGINFEGDVLYCTGDRGYITETGMLGHCGRNDDVCKIGGMKINLNDVTSVVLQIDEVKNALSFDYKTQTSHYIVCVYETKGRNFISRKEIINQIDKKLPQYMIPSRFICVDKMPVNSSGKLNRTEIKEIAISEIEKRNTVESSIGLEEITKLIGENSISIDISKTLTENGMNSLQIVMIYAEMEKRFVRPLEITDMKEITVEELLWNIK